MPGITAYDSQTMFGPGPKKNRKKLEPGMRLGDGRVFLGDDQIGHLAVALEEVDKELAQLTERRNQLVAKIAELSPSTGEEAKPKARKPKANE